MFDVDESIQESIESLQNTIDDVAIIACSGGVDSTVAAVIATKRLVSCSTTSMLIQVYAKGGPNK